MTGPVESESTEAVYTEGGDDKHYTGHGPFHFITLFLLFAAVCVIGYFAVLNRKRVN